MPLRGIHLLNKQNLQQFMGQNLVPMRGMERFGQKREINFPGVPSGKLSQGIMQQEKTENLLKALNIQAQPKKKTEVVKEFFSKFRGKLIRS